MINATTIQNANTNQQGAKGHPAVMKEASEVAQGVQKQALARNISTETSETQAFNSILASAPKFQRELNTDSLVQSIGEHKPNKLVQALSFIGATTCMLLALKHVGKVQNINPFKWEGFKQMEFDEKGILQIAGSSIAGGLIAGLASDFGNAKAKVKESIAQIMGNVLAPVICVSIGSNIWDKVKGKVKFPKVADSVKGAKAINRLIKTVPSVGVTLASLVTGIVIGNRVGNRTVEAIFNEKQDRKIEVTDFSAHIDDMGLAATLMARGSSLSSVISKLIPPALIVPGYMVGTAPQHHYREIENERKQ